MNEEQIEAHRAQFEREWVEMELWINDPNSGMVAGSYEVHFMKELLWSDYLRNEIENNDQNWINRTDRPNL